MIPKSMDKLASKFMTLSKKTKLTKTERAEARQIMVSLKQSGLSNEEISELSGGR
jgi:ABC-type Mn2+/Zn2+ transport system ATPase subunit